MLTRIGSRLALLLVIVATIGCDRVTKHVATETLAGRPTQSYLADTVRLGYTENAGAFLSVGANLPSAARTALFTIGTGLVLLVLAIGVFRFQSDAVGEAWASRCSSPAAFRTGSIARPTAAWWTS